jgi:sugar/nucleoside kinase (ribokinase family)
MNIVIIGHVCIDHNISENASYVGSGSPAMFMQKIYRQFPDCNVTIVASYGSDYAEFLEGISVYPRAPNSTKTLIYENNTKGGSRIQKAHYREEALPVDITPELEEIIRGADVIFFAPLLPNFMPSYVEKICMLKNENAQVALIPQGYYRNFDETDTVIVREFTEANEILPHIDTVIVSEQDHPDMMREARRWSEENKVISIVTLGERGADAIYQGNTISLPTTPVPENEIVDSVGSGDIFSAGFAYRYRQTHDIKEAGRFANELARQCLFFTSNDIRIDYSALFTP